MRGHSAEAAVVAGLIPVLEVATGSREMDAALIDGRVARDPPDLAGARVRSPSAISDETTAPNSLRIVNLSAAASPPPNKEWLPPLWSK